MYVQLTRTIVATLILMFASYSHAELVIIANSDYDGGKLAIEDVKSFYLGKSKTFTNGGKVKPVNQPVNSSDRNVFLERVLNKTESQFSRYWSRIIFSGKGKPPNVLDSDVAVLRWVARNKDAIGYIDRSRVDKSVKILMPVR